jgi:hypothetical protein
MNILCIYKMWMWFISWLLCFWTLSILIWNTMSFFRYNISEKFRHTGNHGHCWKLDWVEMHSQWSSVCITSHVNVTNVTLAKQADLQKQALGSTNITWPKVCYKTQHWQNIHVKKAIKYVWMKKSLCRLNQTPPSGNIRNPPTYLL